MNLAFSYASINDNSKTYKASTEGIALALDWFQREGSFLSRKEREPLFFVTHESFEFFLDPIVVKLCRCRDVRTAQQPGFIAEMERRQSLLVSAPGPQQKLVNDLRSIQKQLASVALDKDQRKQLELQRNEVEQQLYRMIPELKPRVVSVQQIAKALPTDAVLVEFSRVRFFDISKSRGQQWGAGRYVALILRPNGCANSRAGSRSRC